LNLYTRRRVVNWVGLTLSILATLFGLFWLFWLLWTLFDNGLQWIRPRLFLESTPPPGAKGGLCMCIGKSMGVIPVREPLAPPGGHPSVRAWTAR
jgi:phosphate transport system permease protein